MNKYSNWIYRSLDIGLAVSEHGTSEVIVRDNESGIQTNLVFDKDVYTEEEISRQIGDEIYSWILLMKDQLEEDD